MYIFKNNTYSIYSIFLIIHLKTSIFTPENFYNIKQSNIAATIITA